MAQSAVNPTAQLEHERLLSLINSMADAVIAINDQMHIVMYNAAALNLLDVNTDLNGKSIGTVLSIEDRDGHKIDLEEIVVAVKSPFVSRDYKLHYSDNSLASLFLSIAPVRRSFGEQGDRGFVLLMRDITREKSLEDERDEFISVVSHELRTPIAISEGNISNAQFIAEHNGNMVDVKNALEAAHEQVMFLSEMVNDLSTLSRAERGKLAMTAAPFNAHALINSLIENYQPQAEHKGLSIKVELDPKLELLKSSELYIREILQNFITNAIKYTEKGSVTVGAKSIPGGAMFWVSDTGIGIGTSDQRQIFNKFFRSEDFRTRKTNGTGLGLYIVSKLTHLLNAQIKVDSELDKGSTFTLLVPEFKAVKDAEPTLDEAAKIG